MLSLAYACSGEDALKEKVDAIVAGLKECQDALAAQTYQGNPRYSHPGFLSAYGEWQFSALEEYAPYGEIWAPYYTLHKILDGLINAYKHTGNEQALQVAEQVGLWVHSRLSKCSAAQLQRMWGIYIGGEYGGMNDSLVELYWASSSPQRDKFLETARLFDLDSLIDNCAAGIDTLNGKHANQHIPQFVGYIKLYAATGEERYLKSVKGFFDMCVPGRVYPHGGIGEGEMFGPANSVVGDIGSRNAESCAAYNLVKVAWQLFLCTGEARYTEYCEGTVLKHLLGGRRNRQSTTSPENLYMFPVHPGATKEYGNGNIGTCCGGTGLESPMRYQETAYAASADGNELYVNLYMSSTLDWIDNGLVLRQETEYPKSGSINLVVESPPQKFLTVHLRIPTWATSGVSLLVNGVDVQAQLSPGSYAAIGREWAVGDQISLELPMQVRMVPAIDSPVTQSLHYGPTVFSMVTSETKFVPLSFYGLMDRQGALDDEISWKGDRIVFAGREFDPLWAGNDIAYSMYFIRDEKTVIFKGKNSGVANPNKKGGTTMLDEIWEAAPFGSRQAFIERVNTVTAAYVDEGLLTARDRQKVLLACAQARI